MKWLFLSVAALWLSSTPAAGYSVLTHLATVDACWYEHLMPLLTQRYPGATPEEWKAAKANAYGGSIIQDLGYYPFGSELFSNLTHYVRSGDFVRSLLNEAQDRNEYAFALGALAHYVADIKGHSEGTNRAMPSVYPELAAKFGSSITYEEAPIQHTQLEFAFDVVQLAAGRYRASDYHNFIGFEVNKPVLERAFQKTYGLELGQVLFNVDLSVGSFRFAVQQLIPTASRAAWHAERKNILRASPRARRREYVFRQSPRQFRREFKIPYQRPGFGARLLSKVVQVLPKVGPLQPFAFRLPTPKAQEYLKQSFVTVVADYGTAITREQQGDSTSLPLPNYDFDTGLATKVGEYELADETYGEWLRQLADHKFAGVTLGQKQHLVRFFGKLTRPPVAEDEREAATLVETREAFRRLQAFEPAQVAPVSPR